MQHFFRKRTQCNKKIENETFNSYYEESRMDLGSFVFALLLLQARDEKGAEGEGQTPERRSQGGSLQRPLTTVAARGVPGARR